MMRLLLRSLTGVALASLLLGTACGDDGTGGTGGAVATATSTTGMPLNPLFNVPNISVTADSVRESESSVAVTADGTVVSAWIATTKANALRIGYAFSTDGGKTWAPPQVASPGGGLLYGDPTLIVAADKTIYLSFLSFDGGFTHGSIFVAKAAPGATTFEPAVKASAPTDTGPYDKPIVAVTRSQSVVVSYVDIVTGGVDLARSTDGKTFTQAHVVGPGALASLPYTCTDPESDRVWVAYHNGATILIRWSDDDGATFPAANLTRVSDPTEHDISTDDVVCVGKGVDLYVAYARSTDKTNSSDFLWKDYALRLAHSPDGGVSIDRRADVQDPTAPMFTMEPALALEPDGSLDLSYYAGNMAGDPAGSFRWARSVDGGQTFGDSTALAEPINFSLSRTTGVWIGDYSGFVAALGRVFTSYADNASGTAHVSFASAPVVP